MTNSDEFYLDDDQARRIFIELGYTETEADAKIALSKLLVESQETVPMGKHLRGRLQDALLEVSAALSVIADSRRIYREIESFRNQPKEQ